MYAIKGKALTFTDSALRNFAIGAYPGQDGSFGGIYVNAGGAAVNFRGRAIEGVIQADVTSATCEHHWHLKKEYRGQWLFTWLPLLRQRLAFARIALLAWNV